jgi:hypothetical protein
MTNLTNATATVTDCKSHFWGRRVIILEVRRGAFLVKPVFGGPQFLMSKIHARIEEVAA